MKLFSILILVSFTFLYENSFSQNSPFFLWGANLDGSINQKTGIYSDTNNGLLFEAPKDAGGNKLNISFNWRGESSTPRFFIKGSNGFVGVGTTNPTTAFEVKAVGMWDGTIRANTNGPSQYSSFALLENGTLRWALYNHPGNNSSLLFANSAGQDKMAITQDGKLGIGTISPDAKLTVKGNIHAEEVKVDLTVPGPDYVFEAQYNLPSLQEVENYIQQNKHLPEVPSAKEMEQNGINLSEMNMLLLKKVEELTLYVIELKKEVNELKETKK
jgi:hypothetical protein